MWSFLREFTRPAGHGLTVIVLDEDALDQPRSYHVRPRHVLLAFGGGALLLALLVLGLLAITPLRTLLTGRPPPTLEGDARLAAVRLAAMEDSLETQRLYLERLRQLMTAQVGAPSAPSLPPGEEPAPVDGGPLDETGEEAPRPATGEAPAPVLRAADPPEARPAAGIDRYLSSLQFPAVPPVGGFLTRGFDARGGHYAVDIAVKEGTMVRSIGDGYVIFADWTHEGGYALAVQHADGYVSVYKHNQRLLKRPGDRVRTREALAVSGNSGELTTGPHLHFELWQNGLPQDPGRYLVGW